MVQPVPLNRSNLAQLQPPVQVPRFDPAAVTAGIVHLGLGGFHRAHMARYTHNLMERRPDSLAGDSSAALLDAIDRPEIRIVSLTVTEHGYCLNRSTKQLDPDHALIRADLVQPEQPASAVGIIVEAYRVRTIAGTRH